MGMPVVHFEIVGNDPAALREYYGAPFGWEYAVGDAEGLGGKRILGPESVPDGDLAVGRFVDPEGNLVGVAGPARGTEEER